MRQSTASVYAFLSVFDKEDLIGNKCLLLVSRQADQPCKMTIITYHSLLIATFLSVHELVDLFTLDALPASYCSIFSRPIAARSSTSSALTIATALVRSVSVRYNHEEIFWRCMVVSFLPCIVQGRRKRTQQKTWEGKIILTK